MNLHDVHTTKYMNYLLGKKECPSCRKKMTYNRKNRLWECKDCGRQICVDVTKNDDVLWLCDNCGAFLNVQEGFTTKTGIWTCKHCKAENNVGENAICDVCRVCGKKLPKGTKRKLCDECKKDRSERWTWIALITGATAAIAALVCSALGDNQSTDMDNEDSGGGIFGEETEKDYAYKQWTRRLADINEAIYDTRKEKDNAEIRAGIYRAELSMAKEGGPYSPNIPEIEHQINRAEATAERCDAERKRLELVLEEHFKNDPREE